ncbi:MAG: hypothetical protein JWQ91_380 [Aeromicrobium sp.]|uniref:hypothetical protein n=1 Tax=Aeromicrobium sp. TaxID=1871063 RepID=UPI0026311CDC|nr:hypothetical protein [Aeromicrobium sp.]MCW2789081.1 hypothetical protein [Aeromicrobium sp.]MCW2823463.1 hypothetical protein [Aeromicrobium sp.]
MHTPSRLRVTVLMTLLAALLLSGCGSLSEFGAKESSTPATPTPSPTPTFSSQFTRDGTFQSHVDVDGVDFVYTIWPTKSTPRTNLWYPKGNKFFSFTFQAYDLDQELRDTFKTKRKVWLDRIRVESETTTESGAVERPYDLDATASRVTFDPQPVTSKRGMIITSPKGAFELRNQKIGTLAMDTRGLNLIFRATVHIQRSAGSRTYYRETIRQRVPIAIFASDSETKAAKIPVDAN